MVEREETQVVLGQHSTKNLEAKVFVTSMKNPNPRQETRGDQTLIESLKVIKRMSVGFSTLISDQPGQGRKGADNGSDKGEIALEQGSRSKEKENGSNRGDINSIIKEQSTSSPDQMQQLMEQLSMLLSQKNELKNSGIFLTHLTCKNNNTDWLLDLRATDHMRGNTNLLLNFNQYNFKQFVMVANGEKIEILEDGSIMIFTKQISKVLLVKNYASNLLSARKLTNKLHYNLIFSLKNILFKEWMSNRVIGEGLKK
jgi:hypothetical protein